MSETPLFDAALALTRQGYACFPCREDKTPNTKNGLLDATTDPDRLWELFQARRSPLIGVATGSVSGITVIDIDPRHDGDQWEEANTDSLATMAYTTQSGGTHYWFRQADGVRNSAGKIAPGVDVRGDGGYVVYWPAAGQAWLHECDPVDMPAELREAAMRASSWHSGIAGVASVCEGDGSAYGHEALRRECDAIMDAEDGNKHHALNKAAYSIGGLVGCGHLPAEYALEQLRRAVDVLAPRCDDADAAYRTMDHAFEEGAAAPRHVEPYEAPDPGEDARAMTEAIIANSKAPHPDEATTATPYAFPEHLLKVEGFLQEFIDHTCAVGYRPQPVAALAAALSFVSVLGGRKYCAEGTWTNIYAASIIGSGGGKEKAREVIKEIAYEAGLMRYLGGEKLASGSSLPSSLAIHPARIHLIDEFGDEMRGWMDTRSASHQKEIAQLLKTYYTSSNGIVLGKEYADQSKLGRPRVDIINPCVVVYGTTTPEQFWDAVASASMRDGLMGRFMLFIPTIDLPDTHRPSRASLPKSLVEGAKAIASPREGGNNIAALMAAEVKPDPMEVPLSIGAQAALQRLGNVQESILRGDEGADVKSIGARIVQNSVKLALIRAISANPAEPRISTEFMEWGAELSMHCFRTMVTHAARYTSETPFQKHAKEAMEFMRRQGGTCTLNEMGRAFKNKIKSTDVREIIASLKQNGQITETTTPAQGLGRPKTSYRLVADA